MRLQFLPQLSLACFIVSASILFADPLSKKTDIDFFRDVPSRHLKGLATRADGRLVAGPTLTELAGNAPADLLWCMNPGSTPEQWLVGTGPEGRILEITLDAAKASYTARELVKLSDAHIFALCRLPDGAVLAGTSPKGALCLVRGGKLVARIALPVDSILDLLRLKDGTVLAATGNPGRVYRIEPDKFSAAGVIPDKITDASTLAKHGITLFGEIRDRNVRRLALFADGRIAAGSAPKGNIYAFASSGGDPVILQENKEAEVTSLLTEADGDLYATVTFAGNTIETRLPPQAPSKSAKDKTEPPPDLTSTPPPDKFSGRASLLHFPASGFPESLMARNNTAFYGLVRHGDVLLVAAGELGELLGYDVKQRFSLTFAGSSSAQLNTIAAVTGQPERYVVLRNNAPGLALIDFGSTGPRSAETRRLDLGLPASLGALRFDRLRDLNTEKITLEMRVSNGSDEVEGWGPWSAMRLDSDAWKADSLRGRYVKIRLKLAADSAPLLQLDKAQLFHLSQNRRPQVQDFRVLSPNFAVVLAAESTPSANTSLNQLLQQPAKEEEKRKTSFLSSQVVPSPGTQVVLWTVTDSDGDNVECTFSIRRDGDTAWTDIAVATRNPYAQFDFSHLPDGVYFSRLVATETAPRPLADRLSTTFEADDLVVDHTPPEILEATVKREDGKLILSVHGRDAHSLLDSIEAVFNNGAQEQQEQPLDGIRDSRDEIFVLELPAAKIAGATSVEIKLYDAAGNATSRRLAIGP